MATSITNFQDLGRQLEFETEFTEPKRGEIYLVDLSDMALGTIHIMQKTRPALIIQNDKGNSAASTVIIAFLSTTQKKSYPMHYKFLLNGSESNILFEQLMTIDKTRLIKKVGELTYKQMQEAEEKLMFSLQLNKFTLSNIKDIEVINQQQTKTRECTYISFTINIIFSNDERQSIIIKLEKLQEYDNSIHSDIEFDELKKKLDCCRGLNWLVNNNEL
jgi:mRNA interferase MazF